MSKRKASVIDADQDNHAEKVAILGSGNWGSAIARIIGHNVIAPDLFHNTVNMWVYEEEVEVNGKKEKLTEVINTTHENVKYLPGYKLPENVVAVPDPVDAVQGATMLVFVLPHQFIGRLCAQIREHIQPNAKCISLIKGMHVDQGDVKLISEVIAEATGRDTSVLMGANIANEVAAGAFCEATVGYRVRENGLLWEKLFATPRFRISIIEDVCGVELCGALKNIVAIACGLSDGMGCGSNTKAALIRIGLKEMHRFIDQYFPGVKEKTFFESCGVADLITTCHGGRNRRCAEAFAKSGKSWETIEKDLLDGQKLQGTLTAAEIHQFLLKKNATAEFPLFTTTYKIAYEGMPCKDLFENI